MFQKSKFYDNHHKYIYFSSLNMKENLKCNIYFFNNLKKCNIYYF